MENHSIEYVIPTNKRRPLGPLDKSLLFLNFDIVDDSIEI
jgi:hypothetical protein